MLRQKRSQHSHVWERQPWCMGSVAVHRALQREACRKMLYQKQATYPTPWQPFLASGVTHGFHFLLSVFSWFFNKCQLLLWLNIGQYIERYIDKQMSWDEVRWPSEACSLKPQMEQEVLGSGLMAQTTGDRGQPAQRARLYQLCLPWRTSNGMLPWRNPEALGPLGVTCKP